MASSISGHTSTFLLRSSPPLSRSKPSHLAGLLAAHRVTAPGVHLALRESADSVTVMDTAEVHEDLAVILEETRVVLLLTTDLLLGVLVEGLALVGVLVVLEAVLQQAQTLLKFVNICPLLLLHSCLLSRL